MAWGDHRRIPPSRLAHLASALLGRLIPVVRLGSAVRPRSDDQLPLLPRSTTTPPGAQPDRRRGFRQHDVSCMGGPAKRGHDGHLRGLVLYFLRYRAVPVHAAFERSSTGCPSTSTSAASSAILHLLYARFFTGPPRPRLRRISDLSRACSPRMIITRAKMSELGNVVPPDDREPLRRRHAPALRALHGSCGRRRRWSDTGGGQRFLDRLAPVRGRRATPSPSAVARRGVTTTPRPRCCAGRPDREGSADIGERFSFHTAIRRSRNS